MHQLHFQELESTQTYLKKHLNDLVPKHGPLILISTENQTQGLGRGEHQWIHAQNSLAFSFTLKPQERPQLTSLEVVVALIQWLKAEMGIKAMHKWPNDLLNMNQQKCGGILLNLIDSQTSLVGVGINWGRSSIHEQDFPYPAGPLTSELALATESFKELPFKFYQYFLNHRLDTKEFISQWNGLCAHINKQVTIVDRGQTQCGIFRGINEKGFALLETSSQVYEIMNGSLIMS